MCITQFEILTLLKPNQYYSLVEDHNFELLMTKIITTFFQLAKLNKNIR